MKRSRSRLTTILLVFIILFLALIAWLVIFQFTQADDLRKNSLNMRNAVDESHFARGLFYDRNGTALYKRWQNEDGSYGRQALHPNMYSHVIGYNSPIYGKSGLEASYNAYLLNLSGDDPLSQLQGALLGNGQGNDVYLTIDNDLQLQSYYALEGYRGAIICMNPQNGEILSMVSRPSFDLNLLDQNWQGYVEDEENKPLYDRAAMGLYPPGSTMKAISAMALLDGGVDLDYADSGEEVVNGFPIHNFQNEVYGNISLREALIHSSNTYFANKIQKVPMSTLKKTADAFYFNKPIPFDLPVEAGRAEFKEGMDPALLAADSFGQGEILASPLNMLLAYAAIGNQGIMMKPHLVSAVRRPDDSPLWEAQEEILSELNMSQANQVSAYLKDVADGTGFQGQVSVEVAGKTGTADAAEGGSHAWYCAYAPADRPSFAIVVLLEQGGMGGGKARPIAGKLINYWFANHPGW